MSYVLFIREHERTGREEGTHSLASRAVFVVYYVAENGCVVVRRL